MGTGKEAQRRTASSNNLCVGVKVRVTCYGLFLKREDENKDCWKKLSLESNYETLYFQIQSIQITFYLKVYNIVSMVLISYK